MLIFWHASFPTHSPVRQALRSARDNCVTFACSGALSMRLPAPSAGLSHSLLAQSPAARCHCASRNVASTLCLRFGLSERPADINSALALPSALSRPCLTRPTHRRTRRTKMYVFQVRCASRRSPSGSNRSPPRGHFRTGLQGRSAPSLVTHTSAQSRSYVSAPAD